MWLEHGQVGEPQVPSWQRAVAVISRVTTARSSIGPETLLISTGQRITAGEDAVLGGVQTAGVLLRVGLVVGVGVGPGRRGRGVLLEGGIDCCAQGVRVHGGSVGRMLLRRAASGGHEGRGEHPEIDMTAGSQNAWIAP